ncbi:MULTISPECIES: Gfo/Idh/MocA family oxidoreductase [unclassified Crossiella]|uniref:Gfo/Idh/MocA family protein n=1 Tax=unclassified Crossiella TaxID=2620835 RepID=UPI001FFE375C|nr:MULTISPECIES: Gfo/Idh/MocA family oxidoreductase [unclassified Crossiella]MCK2239706.1 Gfo/Idh/MocA family oxidoreductase [Crossiella sp. S99.2]MCK2252401.1 Gfo/Idh/MocA family oxidoreductase [Crossiella sp. S99.1]
MSVAPRLALAGVHGHGRHHLRHAQQLHEQGRIDLVAVCDPRDPGPLPPGVRHHPNLTALLAAEAPAVTVIATPPHTHRALTVAALRAGSDVLLEKPPVLDLSTMDELLALERETGRRCQVGFQTMGSPALHRLAELVSGGSLGEVRGIGGQGAWTRTDAYYRRAPWAGRRRLHGEPVLDGALSNPFAHAVHAALVAAGAQQAIPVSLDLELFRARDVEADDTGCVRLRFAGRPTVTVAVTLAAEHSVPPRLIAHGSTHRAELVYGQDLLTVDGDPVATPPRTDLLANLLEFRANGTPLRSPLAECRTFTEVVAAIGAAPDPVRIPDHHLSEVDSGEQRRVIVSGVDALVAAAAERLATFTELGAPW